MTSSSSAKVPWIARRLVMTRAGWRCQRCGAGRQLQVHHRVAKQMGGTRSPLIHDPRLLVVLCATCHAWAHSRVTEARESGWILRRSEVFDASGLPWPGRWRDVGPVGAYAPGAQADER